MKNKQYSIQGYCYQNRKIKQNIIQNRNRINKKNYVQNKQYSIQGYSNLNRKIKRNRIQNMNRINKNMFLQ